MADNTARKLRTYRIIYRLNLSFANIVAHCYALRESGILKSKSARLYQSFAQELQAEINQDLMSILEHVESQDLRRFGKVRETWEKELRYPGDVFFQAKEERKHPANQQKQGKRSKTKRRRE